MWRIARPILIVTSMTVVLFAALTFGGPLSSGALFFALPTGVRPTVHDLDSAYVPRHGGFVDVGSGLYVRDDDDLWLGGTPTFVFRRTYRSRDRVSRPFGIGATNNAEWYLIGDTGALQWAELILADGQRVRFERVSFGSSHINARFRNHGSPTSFNGAQLGWMGRQWLVRYANGSLAWFRDCPNAGQDCSLDQLRDVDGHVVDFRRNSRGRVAAIEGGSQAIHLEYDDSDRIVRAATTAGQQVTYAYDSAGRLHQAVSSDGVTRRYEYGPRDDLISIEEPGRVIKNEYDNASRVTRQVTRRTSPNESWTWVFEFAYKTIDNIVIETDATEPDGTHTVFRFANRQVVLEIYDARGKNPAMVSLDRGNDGQVTGVTVRCESNGRRVTRTAEVTAGNREAVTQSLIAQECSRGHGAP